MKKTENINLLILGSRTDPVFEHHNVEQNVMVCNWCIEANGPKELYIYSFVSINILLYTS
jgi:hypothetical protein